MYRCQPIFVLPHEQNSNIREDFFRVHREIFQLGSPYHVSGKLVRYKPQKKVIEKTLLIKLLQNQNSCEHLLTFSLLRWVLHPKESQPDHFSSKRSLQTPFPNLHDHPKFERKLNVQYISKENIHADYSYVWDWRGVWWSYRDTLIQRWSTRIGTTFLHHISKGFSLLDFEDGKIEHPRQYSLVSSYSRGFLKQKIKFFLSKLSTFHGLINYLPLIFVEELFFCNSI